MKTTIRRVFLGLAIALGVSLGTPAVWSGDPENDEAPPVAEHDGVAALPDVVKDLPRDPLAALGIVRSRLEFRPYSGFVKGWRGAWWDGTANSADAAELLLEVLRRMRLPGVLVRRKLSAGEAADLLARAAGEAPPLPDVLGDLEGDEVSAGFKDPAIVEAVMDHWFVRSAFDGKWIALDPFFDDAGEPVAGRPKPEVVRHEDRRRLRIELYTRLEGTHRETSVFRFDSPVAELIGTRLTLLLNGINEDARDHAPAPEGLRPVLFVDGKPIVGRPFAGVPASAGAPGGRLGGVFGQPGVGKEGEGQKVTEVRADYVLTGAGLPDRTERRYLYLAGEDGLDRLADITGIAVLGGAAPRAGLDAKFEAAEGVAAGVGDVELPKKGPISDEEKEGAERLFEAMFRFLDSAAHSLASATHELQPRLDAALGTISAYGDARVLGMTFDPRTGGLRTDLVFDTVETWAREGVKTSAVGAHAGIRGRLHADVEGALLGVLRPEEKILTVSAVFTAAEEQEIPLIALGSTNAGRLSDLALSAGVKRVLGERIADGRIALMPERPVVLGAQTVLAWYEYDPGTGAWTGVWEDGRHQAAAETVHEQAERIIMTTFCQGYYAAFNSTLVGYAKEVLWELRSGEFNWTQVHATALGTACKLSDKAMKKAVNDLKGLTKTFANYGAVFGQASAVVLLAVCMPVK